MKKIILFLLISSTILLISCGKSQGQLDAEEQNSALLQENAQLKENIEGIKGDIQNARDNVEQHALDDANDDLDSAEQKVEDVE